MYISRRELAGWAIAVIIVALMGEIVLHGPFGFVNRTQLSAAPSYPTLHVTIVTNPQTVGRYTPSSVTAHPGQQIIFTNASNATHTVTARTNAFDSHDIDIGSSWTFVARKPGTFHYYCVYHPLMLGVIKVHA